VNYDVVVAAVIVFSSMTIIPALAVITMTIVSHGGMPNEPPSLIAGHMESLLNTTARELWYNRFQGRLNHTSSTGVLENHDVEEISL
jgi:hypothetical protein